MRDESIEYESEPIKVLDHGYFRVVESWGCEADIVRAARMSTQKGFLGFGPYHAENCEHRLAVERAQRWADSDWGEEAELIACTCEPQPGDEKLIHYMATNRHTSPFEFGGMTIEVKAPLIVFREWHRHRMCSYSEMSARYTPLPDENYVPSVERLMVNSKTNKQAGTIKGAAELTEENAALFQEKLRRQYADDQKLYEQALANGVPKELARLIVPVGRYSAMRASTDLHNWLGFCRLRCAPNAQWEIRQYANLVAGAINDRWPRTYGAVRETMGLP